MQGRMNYVDLITFNLYISTFITPIRKLSNFAEIFTNGTAGLKRFDEIMRIQPAVKEREDAKDMEVKKGRSILMMSAFPTMSIQKC